MKYERHPSYGYLTAEEYQQAKLDGAGMADYYKKLAADREKADKKERAKRNDPVSRLTSNHSSNQPTGVKNG